MSGVWYQEECFFYDLGTYLLNTYEVCIVKIVASLTDPGDAPAASAAGADLIELRLDLMDGDILKGVQECHRLSTLPVIATLRSIQEGGNYSGNPDEWLRIILPIIPYADYVDIERRFAAHADTIRTHDVEIIASCHTLEMPSLFELFGLERELQVYGDIPKIVVTPRHDEDIIELISFTHAAKKPVCTGVMGAGFRYARLILPLFGSEFVYCHTGTPTAEGQYSVAEAKEAMRLFGLDARV
jgi:3-dehydroquinate dehydratase-1